MRVPVYQSRQASMPAMAACQTNFELYFNLNDDDRFCFRCVAISIEINETMSAGLIEAAAKLASTAAVLVFIVGISTTLFSLPTNSFLNMCKISQPLICCRVCESHN